MKFHTELDILYEDHLCLVVNKPSKLLTIKTNDPKTFSRNLYHQVYEYLAHRRERPFIVHRLDFETSGILIFAKSPAMKERLQKAFEERRVLRLYECVVREKIPCGKTFRTRLCLSENRNSFRVYRDEQGREAITLFQSLVALSIGTGLKVQIETGRKNQIRLSCLENHWTLIGDKRYSGDSARRMYLNAYCLSFPQDIGLQQCSFRIPTLWIEDKMCNPISLGEGRQGHSLDGAKRSR